MCAARIGNPLKLGFGFPGTLTLMASDNSSLAEFAVANFACNVYISIVVM